MEHFYIKKKIVTEKVISSFLKFALSILVSMCLTLTSSNHSFGNDNYCAPDKPQSQNLVHGYRMRGERCEGIYARPVSGSIISIASFLTSDLFYNLDVQSPIILKWRNINKAPVHIRAKSLRPRFYYQMDSICPGNTATFSWPTDVIRGLSIDPNNLGMLAWSETKIAGEKRKVHLPLNALQKKDFITTYLYKLFIILAIEMREISISIDLVDNEGKVLRATQPSTPLQYGYYPVNRGIPIKIGPLKESGIYYVEFIGEQLNGVITSRDFWFYHHGN